MRNAMIPPAGETVETVTIPSMIRLIAVETVLAYGNETAEAFKPVRETAVTNTVKTVRPARRRVAS